MNTDVLSRFDEIYYDLNKINIDDVHIKNRDETKIKFNSLNFKDAKPQEQSFHEYFFSPFKDNQPETYKVLSGVKEEFFYAIQRTANPEVFSDITASGININGIIIYLRYSPYISDDAKENEFNLPIEIIKSWLWRSAGWYISDGVNYGPVAPSGLPSSNNPPLVFLCPDIEGKKNEAKKKVAFLEEKFQRPSLVDYEDDDSYATHFQLRALIDTRFNGLEQEKNFQLFSITNHIQKDMFFIQDQDVYSIKKLINPAEAIDKYAAHLLSRQEGFFDFRDYGEAFQY
ncbi:hypothetical protein KPY62_01635 [Psychrobacter sp. TAE2020]|uniref:hypothetical protein n=1 Tax=Psychrobacter sp. TAE2020 TaxID=2846762 RepID=UPI001C101187|nr:hypothetical protein [Psychrobacter sp. TAE2020]MBU5615823.1 hypothetical protein [Psychrobacter sp. TAE2020]